MWEKITASMLIKHEKRTFVVKGNRAKLRCVGDYLSILYKSSNPIRPYPWEIAMRIDAHGLQPGVDIWAKGETLHLWVLYN